MRFGGHAGVAAGYRGTVWRARCGAGMLVRFGAGVLTEWRVGFGAGSGVRAFGVT